MIRKLPGQRKWRLVSKTTGKNLGTYPTRSQAVKREQQVQFFKRRRYNSGIAIVGAGVVGYLIGRHHKK